MVTEVEIRESAGGCGFSGNAAKADAADSIGWY